MAMGLRIILLIAATVVLMATIMSTGTNVPYHSKIYHNDTLLKTIDVIKVKINNPIYEMTTRMAIVDLTSIGL